MIRFFLTFPFFLLFLSFLFILFLGMLFAILVQFLMRTGRKNKYLPDESASVFLYDAGAGQGREIIDLEEQKKKRWIAILTLVLIVAGLILLNYLKIDERGKIYLERKEKIQGQDYI